MNSKDRWITTATGKRFYFMEPFESIVDIGDVAHALSNICRFGGHCHQFYSVAQHSILCFRIASDEFKYEALMHDSSETYLGDIPSPLKWCLKEGTVWPQIQCSVEQCVATTFGFPYPMSGQVHHIDYVAVAAEALVLLPTDLADWNVQGYAEEAKMWVPEVKELLDLDCEEAQILFLTLFEEYRPE